MNTTFYTIISLKKSIVYFFGVIKIILKQSIIKTKIIRIIMKSNGKMQNLELNVFLLKHDVSKL